MLLLLLLVDVLFPMDDDDDERNNNNRIVRCRNHNHQTAKQTGSKRQFNDTCMLVEVVVLVLVVMDGTEPVVLVSIVVVYRK